MTRLSRVRARVHLPRNERGRDLIVSDLHGHRSLLERELDGLGFDPRHDRVLSVGDLVDRGPESLATLSLLEEPWFHAVLGNHELMLLNYFEAYASRVHSRKSYPTGGGAWIRDVATTHRKALGRLVERVTDLPIAIHVDGEVPFNVTHSSLPPPSRLDDDASTLSVHQADLLTSSRDHVGAALRAELMNLRFGARAVQVSRTPLAEIPITYVGHSPVREVTIHDSYVHIDLGVGLRSTRRVAETGPTVIDHHEFAHWLTGVAVACRPATAALPHRSTAGRVSVNAA